MSHLERFALTLAIIFLSLAAGWFCRRWTESGRLHIKGAALDHLRLNLQNLSIYIFLPVSAMLSLWGLPDPKPELLALPLLGLGAYIWGGGISIFASRLMKLSRAQTGSMFCCGTFTNIGAIGGLVCLLFLGENTIALVALYRLFEEIYYFSVAFPVSQWFGPENAGKTFSLKSVKFQPVLAVIVFALLLGIALRAAHIPRPEFFSPLASCCMILATIFLLFSIGLTLRISRIWTSWRECAIMGGIKFIGIPALVIPLAWLMGFGSYENGLPLKSVAVLCSMPVAMTALVPPALFHLDLDLANACWVFTTAALVIVLPWLLLLLPNL